MIIADTSGLLALFDGSEPQHHLVRALIEQERDPPVVSPYVIAELGYLLSARWGTPRELAALKELSAGAWELSSIDSRDLARAAQIIERYRDQSIGVTDASIVVLADRYETRTVLTLDHRHFDVLRPLSGGRFKVVP